jgi:hypothetical protein
MARRGLVIVLIIGIGLILVGIALAALPLLPHPGKTITPGIPFSYHVSEVVPILPSIPVAVSWSSTAPAEVTMWSCPSFNGNASTLGAQCTRSLTTSQNGTSGSATITIPNGGNLVVTAQPGSGSSASPSVSISLKSTSTTIGFGLLVLGVLVLIVGVFLTREPAEPDSEAPPPVSRPSGPEPSEPAGPSPPEDEEPLDVVG